MVSGFSCSLDKKRVKVEGEYVEINMDLRANCLRLPCLLVFALEMEEQSGGVAFLDVLIQLLKREDIFKLDYSFAKNGLQVHINSTYLHLKLVLRSAVLMSAAGASFSSHSGESWVKHPFLKVPGYQ